MVQIVNETQLFGLGDGDRVQSMIDHALLEGDLDNVRQLSDSLTSAMRCISDSVTKACLFGLSNWSLCESRGRPRYLLWTRALERWLVGTW